MSRHVHRTDKQSAIGLSTVAHGSATRARHRILIPSITISLASLLILVLWRDLPGLYRVRGSGGPTPYVDSPLTGPYRVLLGGLLLAGFGVLFAPELRRRPGWRRRDTPNGCPPRLTRLGSSVGGVGRRRGVYGLWPVQQPGRLLDAPHAAPRRTVTRGYRGAHRLRGRDGEAVNHAHLEPAPGLARRHTMYGGRRRPGAGGLALLSEPGAVHRDRHITRQGARSTFRSGAGGARPVSDEQRAETLALTLLTGYVSLSVIGAGAALNAGLSPRETFRGFAIAVALALPAIVPILLSQQSTTRELER